MTKRNAFTLAEVLITLGIIGVVAAMTMPTLLNSTQGAQYRTAYKKALSVLSQAVVLNVALDDYDLSQTSSADTASASFDKLFNDRMNVVNHLDGTATDWKYLPKANNATQTDLGLSTNYTFFFNDGIVLSFPKTCQAATKDSTSTHCKGIIDVNGSKNPNKEVKCDTKKDGDTSTNCTVESPTDVYPIVMYDQSILPNTEAARAVLYSGK